MSLYTDENIKPEPVMDLYNIHEVENLVAENAALKQQVEQGKRDVVPEELRSLINKAQSHMLRTREADQVSVALTQYLIAAAPKQEK